MHDPLRREIVQRLAIAGPGARRPDASTAGGGGGGSGSASAASRLPPPPGRLPCLPLQISVVQSAGRSASSSVARTVTTIAGLTGSKPNSSSRRHRTRTGLPGFTQRDHRGIRRRIVGAVMAVAAWPLDVLHRDRGGIELQRAGQRRAQRIDTLADASRPAIARRDRAPARRMARSRHGRRASGVRSPRAGLPGVGSAARPRVDRSWLLQQPPRLFLRRIDRVDPVPDDMAGCHGGGRVDDCFVGAENGDEVAVADDLDRHLCRHGRSRPRRSLAIVAHGAAGVRRAHAPCRRAPCRE